MANNFISRLRDAILNKYNNMTFGLHGAGSLKYDYNLQNYIEYGYNINPFVYSVVTARANKFSAIPFVVEKIEKEQNASKSYGSVDGFKMDQPNPLQTWNEFKELFEIYLATTGNVYVYKLAPKEGERSGQPIALYLLPSHKIRIVVDSIINVESLESPVKEYMLIEGDQYTKYERDEVIHIKYPNPNFDMEGSSVYGRSPLAGCWKNVVNSNEALNLNGRMMRNAGAFGLIYSKSPQGFTPKQAQAIKDRLVEMDQDKSRLSNIAGISSEVGFQRLALDTKSLMPFDYLAFDEKQICNALGWDRKLLNNDDGAKYDNYQSAQKRVLIDTIVPDANLFCDLFNEYILPLYGKRYEQYECVYLLNDLPEMQKDMESLINWLTKANDKGFMSKNEAREAMGLEPVDDENMNKITCVDDVLTLEQSLDDFPNV